MKLNCVSALAAFLTVVLYLVKQHRRADNKSSTAVSTSMWYKAALFPETASWSSPCPGPASCTASFITAVTSFCSRSPKCKRDPDLWLEDEILNHNPKDFDTD